jgi:periplasmic divalent cation tolerance protein
MLIEKKKFELKMRASLKPRVPQTVFHNTLSFTLKTVAIALPVVLLCRSFHSTYTMENASRHSVAWITVPNDEVAQKLSHGLVEQRLAACVNIIPKIQSVYWWDGKVQNDSEILLMLKTKTALLEEVIQYVKSNHPYEVPEVISAPIEKGNPDYLKWIDQSTKE